MPKRFVGLAGVYDIGKHLEYETSRDVHELSTMARAVGGPPTLSAARPLPSWLRRCGEGRGAAGAAQQRARGR